MNKMPFAKAPGPAVSGDAQHMAAGLKRLERVLTGTGKAYLAKGDSVLDAGVILDNARVLIIGANTEGRTLHIPYVNREIIFASNPGNLFECAIATDKVTLHIKPGQNIKVFMDGFGGMDVIGGSNPKGATAFSAGQGQEGKRGPEGKVGPRGGSGSQGIPGPRGPQGIQGPLDSRFQVRGDQLLFVTDEGTFLISATKLQP